MSGSIVDVVGLRKVFGRGSDSFVAVDDVTFSLEAGASLAIVGESGSGKSTIAKMLVGLELPTAGEITVCGRSHVPGKPSTRERRRRASEIQIVFQDPYTSLDPCQPIGECLDEALRLHTDLDRAGRLVRTLELLDQVGLNVDHGRTIPGQMSGGQRQRVAIARALACEPRVLVLDEAVSALDVSIQGQILNLLVDLRAALGITYLFISHDLAVVRHVTDDAIVLRRGAVVERGATRAVLDAPQHPYTQLLRASVPHQGWKPHDAWNLLSEVERSFTAAHRA